MMTNFNTSNVTIQQAAEEEKHLQEDFNTSNVTIQLENFLLVCLISFNFNTSNVTIQLIRATLLITSYLISIHLMLLFN